MEQIALSSLVAGVTAEPSAAHKQVEKRRPLIPARLLIGMAASIGLGSALGKLAGRTLKRQTHDFDGYLLDATRAVQSPIADSVMIVMSAMGEPLALYSLSGLVASGWVVQHRQRDSAAVALAIVGSAVIDKAVKSVVKRPRPFLKLPLPRSRPSGSSFPSNHATMSLATYGAVALLAASTRRKRRGTNAPGHPRKDTTRRRRPARRRFLPPALAVLFCALVGWSRVYRGVHNPSDVLGGWLVGAIWLAACTSWAKAARNG
jgi:undecaprenyl-diphosphatase